MDWKYKVEYVESEESIADMFKIHKIRELNLSVKVLPACLLILGLYVSWRAGYATGKQGNIFAFWGGFLLVAVLMFALGEFYRRYFGTSGNIALAKQKAQEIYAKRRKLGEVRVEFRFYEDYLESRSKMDNVKAYYVNVRSMFETKDMIAFTVLTENNQKQLYGIPKDAFKRYNINLEEMKAWMEEKCTSAKKGFIALDC